MSVLPQPTAGAVPLSRRSSRLTSALTHAKSIDAHPPHHAHFDESPEIIAGPSRSRSNSNSNTNQGRAPISPGNGNGDGGVDLEKGERETRAKSVVDIEHVPVEDDPREWSDLKKNLVLTMMTISVLGPLINPSIYNPVIDEVKSDLNATDTQIGLSLSMFILLQGGMTVCWSTVADIIGRKPVYLTSFGFYTVGSIVASRAPTMPVLIGMRCLQAIGSSAVISVGAGSLADMYEVHERGQKLGLFYGMPLLGPALGPLIGGALGNAFGWRASLYFISAFAGCCWAMFLFFPDTWRRERSRAYQIAIERALKRALAHEQNYEKRRQRKIAKGLPSNAPTPPQTPGRRESIPAIQTTAVVDTEQNEVVLYSRDWRYFGLRKRRVEEHQKIQPSFRDINPIPVMIVIFKKPTNAIVLLSSSILFAAQYTVTYTAAITLAAAPYNYNPLIIGVVILSFGAGNMVGSVAGGKWSDVYLRRLREANNGVSVPEMRLKGTVWFMPILVASFLTYAWTAGSHVNIAGIVISLFFAGLSVMLIYASTLAYLVDVNPGRSSAAVSSNSFVRGCLACVMSQIARPIQDAIGDGGLYTIFAGLLTLSSLGIMLVAHRGERIRMNGNKWSSKLPDQETTDEESKEQTEGGPRKEVVEPLPTERR